MKSSCDSICGKDCFQSFYFLRIAHQSFGVDFWSFSFSRPDHLVTRIVWSASTTFPDFLSVIMNGASFWLMFSPFALLMSPRVVRYLDKRSMRRKTHKSYIRTQVKQMNDWFDRQKGLTVYSMDTNFRKERIGSNK